jgi:hypothetical protein
VDLSGYALKASDFNTALTSSNKGATMADISSYLLGLPDA